MIFIRHTLAVEQHGACNVYSISRNTTHLLFLQRRKMRTLQAKRFLSLNRLPYGNGNANSFTFLGLCTQLLFISRLLVCLTSSYGGFDDYEGIEVLRNSFKSCLFSQRESLLNSRITS